MNARWLFITVPLLLIGGAALLNGIGALRAALRATEVAVLPLAGAATVEIAAAGELVLALRGRLGTRDFAAAEFTLRDAGGEPVPSSLIVVRTVKTSLDGETTLAVRRFRIRTPGRHELIVTGLEAAALAGNSRLVLTRPGGVKVALRVAWVVAAGVLLLAAIVFSALAIFLPRTAARATGSPSHASVPDHTPGATVPADGPSAARAAGTLGHRADDPGRGA